jgi:Acetyltransferase (GNAT) domain
MNEILWSKTSDSKEWDDFVSRNGGNLFQLWSWRTLLETTGARPLYLTCRNAKGTLIAVCPFFYDPIQLRFVPGALKVLDSLPYVQSGPHIAGPIINNQQTNVPEILDLLHKSIKFSIHDPVISIILRVNNQLIVTSLIDLKFSYQVEAGDFVLNLDKIPPEQIWNKVLPANERKEIRYFDRSDLSVYAAESQKDRYDFLDVYFESMKRQNYKPISSQFFHNMQKYLGNQFKVFLIVSKNEVVGGFGLLCDVDRSEVRHSYVGYTLVNTGRSFMPYIYWKIVNWASENGFRNLNFGRTSPNPLDPIHRMKGKFGAEFFPEYKFVLPVDSAFVSFAKSINKIFQVRSRVSS